jgi:DNA-binding MarR family transcriptional regulator
MHECLPLPTLLSQALVAFTIEFDNEAEWQMPHRTTRHGSKERSLHAPFLVSMVMWSNCMQFVGEERVPVRELERRARTTTNLPGMQRWGYIVLEPDPTDRRPKPPRAGWLVRSTSAGRKAQAVWRPLFGTIEKRWQRRFGQDKVGQLRKSLWAVVNQIDLELPDCLPILKYGLFTKGPEYARRAAAHSEEGSRLPLSALLSRVLLAFAINFEAESELSLAICANIVRVLDEKGVRVRDLPFLTGLSKEAINMAMGVLRKKGLAVVQADSSGGRAQLARLTPKGGKARDAYRQLLGIIEERRQARFGKETIGALRTSLERIVGDPNASPSRLLRGLEPYPDG